MKNRLFLFIAIFAILIAAAGNAFAGPIMAGPFGAKYSDFTYTDFDYGNPAVNTGWGPSMYHPGQDENSISGNVWGITALTSVHNLGDGNVEGNALDIPAYYNGGDDGFQYYAVYGGLTFSSYNAAANEIHLAQAAGQAPAYLKIYQVPNANASAYNDARDEGPNVAGAGAFGTFGLDIINGGTLWLDTVFSDGILQEYSSTYQAGDLEIISLSSTVTGSAEGYLDIIGGSAQDLFLTGIFPVNPVIGADFADLKIISDLTANFNGVQWTNDLWTTTSQDPITGAGVPEPSTIMLLGAGILGFACYSRKRHLK